MKKRVLALVMASVMATAVFAGCSSDSAEKTESTSSTENKESKESSKKGDYQYVSPADAVKAANSGDTHVLDVRTWDDYTSGRIANSEWCPIFPLEDDSLGDAMADYAKDKLNDDKEIYIVCNSGQRGAEKATKVMEEAGIDTSLIYTVEGGAKALKNENGALTTNRADENIEWQTVSGKDTVKAVGDDEIQILDVRDDDTYKAGHLKDSLQCNLKDIEDPKAQTAMYKLATEKMDKDKPVYLLCYSGNKCAKTGISVMKDAGFDTDKLFIVENGAKDGDIQAAFVKE